MLRTIVIQSKNRISGTTSDYLVPLNDVLEPGVDYYRLKLANFFPDSGVSSNPSGILETVLIKANFNQPFSYDTGRKGSNEIVGMASCSDSATAVPMIRSFQTVIRAPTFNTLRVWFESLMDSTPFIADDHILVLELEPLKN